MTVLELAAIFPAVATPVFVVFWTGFELWRRHPALIVLTLSTMLCAWIAALVIWREPLLASALALPWPAQAVGWAIAALSFVLAVVADRQLGLHLRAGLPFFEDHARIRLRTRGAYGVVRHPIYAAGIYYQIGMWLITGSVAIGVAAVVLAGGALWFTRQEERRLAALLEDPSEYERYRARVGALFPRLRRAPPRAR